MYMMYGEAFAHLPKSYPSMIEGLIEDMIGGRWKRGEVKEPIPTCYMSWIEAVGLRDEYLS